MAGGPPPEPRLPWKKSPRNLAIVAGFLIVANVAYALNLPGFLYSTFPAMPLGYHETASPEAPAGTTFVDVAEASGLRFNRISWEGNVFPYPVLIGGGVGIRDYDNDGDEDLFFTPGGDTIPAVLYRNNGDGTFTDVTDAAGLRIRGYATAAGWADFDNDGWGDLYVAFEGASRLFRSKGDGTFEDVTEKAGVSNAGKCGTNPCVPGGVTWFDHDRDGLLDLYVSMNVDWHAEGLHTSGNDFGSLVFFAPAQLSILYRNLGNGAFEDVTELAGVENTGKGLGVVASDFDNDGWQDLYIANDLTENAMYKNLGDGTFKSVARSRGVNEVKTSMGVSSGDVNGDGLFDLVVSNFRGHKLSLLLQNADHTFRYVTDENGLGASWRGTGWGVQFFDYDLDGWLDVMHAVGRAVPLDPHLFDLNNLVFKDLVQDHEDELFRNLGNGSFAEVTHSAGAFSDHHTTRAIAAFDYDGDGDEDVIRVNLQGAPAALLRNDLDNGHKSVRLELVGTESNRDAVGARVDAVRSDGMRLAREVVIGTSYQVSGSRILTLGMGAAETVDVTIRWPNGLVETVKGLAAGERVKLVEGDAGAAGS